MTAQQQCAVSRIFPPHSPTPFTGFDQTPVRHIIDAPSFQLKFRPIHQSRTTSRASGTCAVVTMSKLTNMTCHSGLIREHSKRG